MPICWNVPQETDAEKIARLEREIERLKQENERLRHALEEALRAGKRQAAPFSRQTPKAHPQRPGRKPGANYGRSAYRAIPTEFDETIEVALPDRCPHCGGGVDETGEVIEQYQTEIPEPRVEHIRFRIRRGYCRQCGRRVQGRHRRQTSKAVGSAASQLGPRAIALATQLDKGLGLSHEKTAAILEAAFGLRVSRGGLCQAFHRMARKAEPTYQGLIQHLRHSPAVTPDETGWKVSARLWWMWAFASSEVTVYSIQPGRAFAQAALILGADFAGFLIHDGWCIYLQFQKARHQTCLAHLLRRCREMLELASPCAARFPRTVQLLLRKALELRHRRDIGAISEHGLAVARGQLEARMERAWQPSFRCLANERLANHLYFNRDLLFTFLYFHGLDATNWRAEQALRPAVVARKVWGGNRTPAGAHTQEVLLSVLQTCRQQKLSFLTMLVEMLCCPTRKSWNLIRTDRSPPIPGSLLHSCPPIGALSAAVA